MNGTLVRYCRTFTSTLQLWLLGLLQVTTVQMEEAQSANAAKNRSEQRPMKDDDKKASVAAEVGPSAFAALAMLGLVFGGCCSNVCAENIQAENV